MWWRTDISFCLGNILGKDFQKNIFCLFFIFQVPTLIGRPRNLPQKHCNISLHKRYRTSLMAFFWYQSKVNTSTEMHFELKWMEPLCLNVNCSRTGPCCCLGSTKKLPKLICCTFSRGCPQTCVSHKKRRQFCHHHAVHFRSLCCMVG